MFLANRTWVDPRAGFSEEGLVKRGALAAFGADMYQWGYQSGAQAAQYLKTKSITGLQPQLVKDFRVIENRQLYERVDDMDFLRALLDPELFGEDN